LQLSPLLASHAYYSLSAGYCWLARFFSDGTIRMETQLVKGVVSGIANSGLMAKNERNIYTE
jgi:hypothetical protein